MHDPAAEARRWWTQAQDDRAFVHDMERERRYFDKACFIAQQAGEKALKACLYAEGRREVLGHALLEFVRDLCQREPAFQAVGPQAARYPRQSHLRCPLPALIEISTVWRCSDFTRHDWALWNQRASPGSMARDTSTRRRPQTPGLERSPAPSP